MNEDWLKIPNYSNYNINKKGEIRNKNGLLLKPYKTHNGYSKITLVNDFGEIKHERINRLVAELFLDKTNFKYLDYEDITKIDIDELQVNHKDENKLNNNINNLEWCTADYNQNYSTHKRYNKIIKKHKNGNTLKEYNYYGEIFIDLGFDIYKMTANEKKRIRKHIANCCNGKSKSAYGFYWERI